MYSKSNLSAWDSWDSLVYLSEAAATNYEAGPETASPENMQSFTVSVIYSIAFEFFIYLKCTFFRFAFFLTQNALGHA